MKSFVAIALNVFLGLFAVDAVVSFADDTLAVFWGVHWLFLVRQIIGALLLAVACVVYLLMGFTRLVPKRWILPLIIFIPVSVLGIIPFAIYQYQRLQLVGWVVSLLQLLLVLVVIFGCRRKNVENGRFISESQLGDGKWSWWKPVLFVGFNLVVVPLATACYLAFCAGLAVDHFTEGFLSLHPRGFSVQVRKYARADGKTIRLIPMSHIGDSSFYHAIARSFPSNSIILMEGVTDDHHLLTNEISYQRMAKSLGVSEQETEFDPEQGEMIDADVDVSEFSKGTIDFLNLVMLLHSRGINAQTVLTFFQSPPPPGIEMQVFDDILHKRNRHLLQEIDSWLPEAECIMVPWGVAHMPEIAAGIRKAGFTLVESNSYQVIHFGRKPKRAGR